MGKRLYDDKNRIKIDLPFLSVCLFLLLFPIDSALGNLLGGYSINNYVAVACVALLYFSKRKINIKINGLTLTLFAYFCYQCAIMSYSPLPLTGRNLVSAFYSLFAILLGCTLWNNEEKKLMIASTLLGGLIAVLIVAYNLTQEYFIRIYVTLGSYVDPNYYALNLIFLTAILVELIFKSKYRWLFLLLLLLDFAMILFLGSRSGLLGNLAVVILLVCRRIKKWQVYAIGIPLLLAVYFLLLEILPQGLADRFHYKELLFGTGSGRTIIWKEYLIAYARAPFWNKLFGFGRGAIYAYEQLGIPVQNCTHNLYIKALIEGGVVGVAFLVFLLTGLIKHIRRSKNKALYAILLGCLVGGMFLDVDDYRIAYLLYAFCLIFANTTFDFTGERYFEIPRVASAQKERPTVSVIIPFYNVKGYLAQCVRSVTRQTYKNLEIILVDDGSTDGSGALCDELCKADDRIRVIHKENGGISTARNVGLDEARGDFIAFVDGDDCVCEEYVARLMQLHEETGAELAVGEFYRTQKDLEVERRGEIRLYTPQKAIKEMLSDKLYLAPWGKLYKRELFDGLRFPEGLIYEDYAVIPKVAARANKIARVNAYLYYYRPNAKSITGITFNPNRMQFFEVAKGMDEYFAQNFPRLRKRAMMRHTKYAISFYKQIGESGFEDEKIEVALRSYVKKNILRYSFFADAPLLSKGYGLAIALAPKKAKRIMKNRG